MAGNDDMKPDTDGSDEPVGELDGSFEDTSFTVKEANLRREEKARTLIERGKLSYAPVYGEGEYADRLRGIIGDSEQANEDYSKKAYREAAICSPEIFVCKYTPPYKRNPPPHIPKLSPGFPGVDETPPTHITKEQFIDLYSAVCFANGYGVALATHVTIDWELLGFTDHSKATAVLQARFIHNLAEWFKYRAREHTEKYFGSVPAHELYWIYSNECSATVGFHTHFLVGIPPNMRKDFNKWVKKRIEAISEIKPVPPNAVKVKTQLSHTIKRQWIRFQYLCKGLDPQATVKIERKNTIKSAPLTVQYYYQNPLICDVDKDSGNFKFRLAHNSGDADNINKVPLINLIRFNYENPGQITCKMRINKSDNLLQSEREKIGFKSLMENGVFDKRKLYTSEIYDGWHRENSGITSDINDIFN